MSAAKYKDIQHNMANDMIGFYKELKSIEWPVDCQDSEFGLISKILFILKYLDKKAIINSKLDDVHAYVQCIKEFDIKEEEHEQ